MAKPEQVVAAILFIAILALSVSCGIAHYNECRRIHPWWYCAMEK
jgi:hypothetical protein